MFRGQGHGRVMATAALHVAEAPAMTPAVALLLLALFNPTFGGGIPPTVGATIIALYAIGYAVCVACVLGR